MGSKIGTVVSRIGPTSDFLELRCLMYLKRFLPLESWLQIRSSSNFILLIETDFATLPEEKTAWSAYMCLACVWSDVSEFSHT